MTENPVMTLENLLGIATLPIIQRANDMVTITEFEGKQYRYSVKVIYSLALTWDTYLSLEYANVESL